MSVWNWTVSYAGPPLWRSTSSLWPQCSGASLVVADNRAKRVDQLRSVAAVGRGNEQVGAVRSQVATAVVLPNDQGQILLWGRSAVCVMPLSGSCPRWWHRPPPGQDGRARGRR